LQLSLAPNSSKCTKLVRMIRISGVVQSGHRHFSERMTVSPAVFEAATGESLYPGTLNVKVSESLPIREDFRIQDPLNPAQDLLFEICRINGRWAYRIRPYHRETGEGGHGDNVLEIACSAEIPNAKPGREMEIEFFR
jgi:hypothetical protein